MRKILLSFLAFCAVVFIHADIITPYPTTIELNQINSAEKERIRLRHTQKKFDKQPTGFYIPVNKKIVVDVEVLTPAADGAKPVLTIGTLGFNVDERNTGQETVLNAGKNTITYHQGGLVWLSYISNAETEPTGKVKITFTAESQHVRAPRFVFGTTTNLEFKEMLTEYDTPDVLYHSDYVVVVATKEAANLYSKDNNKVAWLNAIHTLLEKEDDISGLDNEDSNPIHHRLKAGAVRHLLVENTFSNPHANSAGYTGYPNGSRHRYLTEINKPGNNSWMLGHEIGHQHQQSAYLINKATESTVNLYSYVVERHFYGEGYNRTTAQRWMTARNTYLKLPFSKRIYDMDDGDLEAIVGFNRDELRFMPWEQCFLIFGDQFYRTLHRITREEKMDGGTADERRAYLIWKASQITGYDMTEFYNIWGIRVNNSAVKADLRAKMAYAKSNGEIRDFSDIGLTADNLTKITGQNMPSWAPITMLGITSSAPAETLDRSAWTVETSYEGVVDASVGGDDPNNIIDESTTTAFLFVKPGQEHGDVTVPGNAIPSFTIDMREKHTFNTVVYTHRLGNTTEWLRARKLSIYVSDDGENFIPIEENYLIDHVQNLNVIDIPVPKTTCRYIQVVINDWNWDSGKTIQVADLTIATKLPAPDPIQFKVNVSIDEGIETQKEGVNMVNEDGLFTVEFTAAEGYEFESLIVDDEPKNPTFYGGVYRLSLIITNHTDINIVSKVASGFDLTTDQSAIRIYPSMLTAGETTYIQLSELFVDAFITVFSATGNRLMKLPAQGNTAALNLPMKGVHIVEVQKNNQAFYQKIIVQ
ncbi:MAG: M60 family metallopeptidase [Pigmentiphaga sp.]|nr:M60 family metallopeptidase [Pigmentiphaga sp.]